MGGAVEAADVALSELEALLDPGEGGGRYAVLALTAKRREMAGKVRQAEAILSRLRADLAHLDGALAILAPHVAPDDLNPKRQWKRGSLFAWGELPRLLLKALREAGQPMPTDAIARRIAEAAGLAPGEAQAERLSQEVARSLARQRGRGLVTSTQAEGGGTLWAIAAPMRLGKTGSRQK